MRMILTPLTTGVIYWCATRHVRWHLEEAFTPHRQWQSSTGYHWKGMIGVWGLFAWNPTHWGQSQEPWCCYGDWNNCDAINSYIVPEPNAIYRWLHAWYMWTNQWQQPYHRTGSSYIPQEWYRKGSHTPLAGDHRSHARLTDEANCEEISSYF